MESAFKVPIRNLFCMLSYVQDMPDLVKSLNEIDEDMITYDFICKQFLNEADKLIRRGLIRDYIAVQESTGRLGGRIQFNESLPLIAGRAPALVCERDNYSENIPLNQIILGTLKSIYANRYVKEETRRSSFMLTESLPGVDSPAVTAQLFARNCFHRHNSHYKRVVHLARMLYELTLLSHKRGSWSLFSAVVNETDLNRIFEKFLLHFYQIEQNAYHVKSETMQWSLEGNRSFLPSMRTDISLIHKSGTEKIVMDAKFYKHMFQESYGKTSFHSHNLYQLFTYLMHQPKSLSLRGILIYPYNGTHVREVYRWNETVTMEVMTLDLNQSWGGIHKSLLKVVE
jgi:5-methylcytosine-specific restriction enzyme subunit McrC